MCIRDRDSTFLYFFGLPYAGLAAIIDVDEDKEIIFGDELDVYKRQFIIMDLVIPAD